MRRGETLSPLLFAIYINDLESYIINEHCNGVKINDNVFNIFYCMLTKLLFF